MADAVSVVFRELVDEAGLETIAEVFGQGVRIEVGDLVPSSDYEGLMQRVPEVWQRALEVNAATDPAVRASAAEFLLAGLHATDRISRSERFGRTIYETGP